MNTYQNFKEEFIKKYNEEEFILIEKMVDSACKATINDKNYIEYLGDWECSLNIEKLSSLNFCYYIYFFNEKSEDEINIDFGFGVDMQNECTGYSFQGISSSYSDREIEILDDIILDTEEVINYFNNTKNLIKNVPNEFLQENLIRKASIIFEREKDNILKLYSNRNYDEYVTGGGTSQIDSYYKDRLRGYNDKGIYWKCIYKTEYVDRNLY